MAKRERIVATIFVALKMVDLEYNPLYKEIGIKSKAIYSVMIIDSDIQRPKEKS